MTLIGNCQSEKVSCTKTRVKCCSSTKDFSVSKIEAQKLLKELNYFLTKQISKHQKHNCFEGFSLNYNLLSSKKAGVSFTKLSFGEFSEIQKKTSIIRNKDQLENRFLV